MTKILVNSEREGYVVHESLEAAINYYQNLPAPLIHQQHFKSFSGMREEPSYAISCGDVAEMAREAVEWQERGVGCKVVPQFCWDLAENQRKRVENKWELQATLYHPEYTYDEELFFDAQEEERYRREMKRHGRG